MDIEHKLRTRMQKRSWSKALLAQYARLPQSTPNSMFRNGRTPRPPTLQAVYDAFGETLPAFFPEQDGPDGRTRRGGTVFVRRRPWV